MDCVCPWLENLFPGSKEGFPATTSRIPSLVTSLDAAYAATTVLSTERKIATMNTCGRFACNGLLTAIAVFFVVISESRCTGRSRQAGNKQRSVVDRWQLSLDDFLYVIVTKSAETAKQNNAIKRVCPYPPDHRHTTCASSVSQPGQPVKCRSRNEHPQ